MLQDKLLVRLLSLESLPRPKEVMVSLQFVCLSAGTGRTYIKRCSIGKRREILNCGTHWPWIKDYTILIFA